LSSDLVVRAGFSHRRQLWRPSYSQNIKKVTRQYVVHNDDIDICIVTKESIDAYQSPTS